MFGVFKSKSKLERKAPTLAVSEELLLTDDMMTDNEEEWHQLCAEYPVKPEVMELMYQLCGSDLVATRWVLDTLAPNFNFNEVKPETWAWLVPAGRIYARLEREKSYTGEDYNEEIK